MSDISNLIILLIIIILLVWAFTRNEKFDGSISITAYDDRYNYEDPIEPTYTSTDVRSMMSGAGYTPQKDILPPWGTHMGNGSGTKYGIPDGLDDGEGGSLGLEYNLCSPSCCTQPWPTPFYLPEDKEVAENKNRFVPNNYTCSNQWQQSGCLCMTKRQAGFLYNRGGNA